MTGGSLAAAQRPAQSSGRLRHDEPKPLRRTLLELGESLAARRLEEQLGRQLEQLRPVLQEHSSARSALSAPNWGRAQGPWPQLQRQLRSQERLNQTQTARGTTVHAGRPPPS